MPDVPSNLTNLVSQLTLEEKASLVIGSDFWHTAAVERLTEIERQLENTVERAVVIAPGDEITKECLRSEISDPQSVTSSHHDGASNTAVGDIGRGINFYEEVRRFEIDLIRRALEQTGGHQSRAARLLGMNATTLNSKIKTYNINLRP